MTIPSELVIPARFNGPDTSANGGYAAGSVAQYIDGVATVRLAAAPPLDTPLRLVAEGDTVAAHQGDDLVLVAGPGTLDLEVPDPVDLAAAELAAEDYPGWVFHGATHCFVCGPDREAPDGQRVFPGPVAGRDVVAAPWTPRASLANETGVVDPRFAWAVLDCPGAWAATAADPVGMPYFPALGTMTAALDEPIIPGEPLVVIGWHLGTDGRKLHTASAIMSPSGDIKARARHIEIKLPADWAG